MAIAQTIGIGIEDGLVRRRRLRRERLFYRLCAAPALLLTLLVGIAPLGLMLVQSVRDQQTQAWTLDYYLSSFTNSFFTRTLATTIAMAAGVAILAILIALPMAYLLARKALVRNLLMPVITVPRMLPFVVVGYAMILLLAPFTGVLNKVLIASGLISQPLFILFDWPGQALAFFYAAVVVAIGILTGVLMSVDPQLEDAAVSLGASRLRSFFAVTLPLSVPGIIAAGALVFTSVTTAYSIPVMLAGRTPYMISIVVATNLLTLQQPHLAYAQAVVVSVLAIGATAFAQIVLSRYGHR
ncbi:MAG TPA: ABC transporter permease subunit [Devosiaceae bacterium]